MVYNLGVPRLPSDEKEGRVCGLGERVLVEYGQQRIEGAKLFVERERFREADGNAALLTIVEDPREEDGGVGDGKPFPDPVDQEIERYCVEERRKPAARESELRRF
jgi:hypothetical protein